MNKLQRHALEDVEMLAKALDPNIMDFDYWKREDIVCGTKACLAGYAITFLPSVQKLGLSLKQRNPESDYWELALNGKISNGRDNYTEGLNALTQAFGVPYIIIEKIFGANAENLETKLALKNSVTQIKKYLRTH